MFTWSPKLSVSNSHSPYICIIASVSLISLCITGHHISELTSAVIILEYIVTSYI